MSPEPAYRVNTPNVISEVIDGEAVILNFESGSYYGLNLSGMVVWEAVRQGLSQREVLARLHQRFSGATDSAAADLTDLLGTLESEQLIVRVEGTAAEPVDYTGPSVPYEIPALHKFTDLQELLLLDPIHDVDESGWPHHTP